MLLIENATRQADVFLVLSQAELTCQLKFHRMFGSDFWLEVKQDCSFIKAKSECSDCPLTFIE